MARSLGLATYLAFARRQPPQLRGIDCPRPDGEVIWVHCAEPSRARTLAKLGLRLAHQRANAHLLLTTPAGASLTQTLPEGAIWQPCPSENPSDIAVFLAHWAPDLALWIGPALRPALIDAIRTREIPSILLEAQKPKLEQRRRRWGPEPIRGTLARFTSIFTQTEEAQTRFGKLLGDTADVQFNGILMEEAPALPVQDSDLEEVRASLAGRPVWLAARLQPRELNVVLNAYRSVLRLSYRMLLVVVPDNPADAANMKAAICDDGWRVADWDDGDFPEENTQVLFTHTPDELGLWYRVAPVSLVGSSLKSGAGGRDPLEPAALGSAILYGPSVRRYLSSYTRLANEGAARIVKDANSLTAALMVLAAPDQVAAMAHAGWKVVSDSAAVSDQVINHAHALLDTRSETS
ncbi:3-deoxy-D-manno-octulosonic acid transferase [Shimia marina]|uniref:3-deoxy-D-manno-octulosonic acid transferase n=1 Tax=Shimia marina TaxID=321267 RepID=A0A0P1ELW8_9RHOB|nr:glycosyltransferase N-terminal domain-containing protein [Shimia marina]CUH51089.1 3-deoxy-D-manno-octulosonic acid transferase [Shimia marina]SFD58351.1 3-deoxy-D-manno-octulosonic-acid transferase [Shimia marina]